MKRRDFLKGLLAVSVAPLATCSFIPQKPGISEIPDYECGAVYDCGVADTGRIVVLSSSDGWSEGDVLLINGGASIRDVKYTITSINKKNFTIEQMAS